MSAFARRNVTIGLSALAALRPVLTKATTDHLFTINGMKFAPADLMVTVGDSITVTFHCKFQSGMKGVIHVT